MKNPIKGYKFWVQAISAAILLVVGIVGILNPAFLVPLVVMISGGAIIVFAVIRFIPLMKTLKTGKSKLLTFVELSINAAIGVVLFYGGLILFKDNDNVEGFAYFAKNYYRVLIGIVLYLRAVCYYICTILFKEETDGIKFWVHLAFITLGIIIIFSNSITAEILAYIAAIIALLGSVALVVDSGSNYSKYRKSIKIKREKEKVKKSSKEENKYDEPTNNIPLEEPKENVNQTYVS